MNEHGRTGHRSAERRAGCDCVPPRPLHRPDRL